MSLTGPKLLIIGRITPLSLISVLFIFSLILPTAQAIPIEQPDGSVQHSIGILPPGAAPAITKAMQKELTEEYQLKKHENGYFMSNPSHGMSIIFTPAGPQIKSGNNIWGMTMSGIGYEGSVQPADNANLFNDDGVMIYDRGNVSEWYMNSRWGVEQGFTVQKAPQYGKGMLVVQINLSGDLESELQSDALLLTDSSGTRIARYTSLQVFDSENKVLPAHLELADNTLSIFVDDKNAEYPITIDPWIQQAKLTASDGGAGDFFGGSVSISGETIVIGTSGDDDYGDRSGSAYVFEKPTGGWTTMTESAKLTPSDPKVEGYFGHSVAISGDTIVVGAFDRDDPAYLYSSGAAYVFEKPPGGWSNMTETAVLTASDQQSVDRFGSHVAIDGDTIVVGAYCGIDYPTCSGAAYVYVKPIGGWSTMTESAKLTAGNTFYFGRRVSINGDTIVVGTYLVGDIAPGVFSPGAAYVFEKPIAGWSSMTGSSKLTASDRTENDRFGSSVSVSGDTIVIGAPLTDALDAEGYNADDSGSAYIFERPASGWTTMNETAKLTASDRTRNDQFGWSVFVNGETIVVGAPYDDENATDAGSAYVFKRPLTGWTDVTEGVKITAHDSALENRFGGSVSVSDEAIAVGAGGDQASMSGSAYISFVKPMVSASVGSFGSLDPSTSSPQIIDYYSTTQFTFNADPGYHVTAISGCGIDFLNTDEIISSKTVTTDIITGDCIVTASFSINLNTIAAYAGENGSLDVATPSPQTVNYGETVQFTFIADQGYHIEYIFGCGISNLQNFDNEIQSIAVSTDPFTESCSVYAYFGANWYIVSAMTNNGGYVDFPWPQAITHGDTTQFTFNADAGYHIQSISGCGIDIVNTDESLTNKTVSTSPIQSDCTVSADFAINQNTVIATAGAYGSLDPSTPSPQIVNSGETAQFTFNADVGAHIISISGCGIDFVNTDYALTSKMVAIPPFSESCTVSALFARNQYSVSAAAGPNGTLDATTPTPKIINYNGVAKFIFNAETLYHIETVYGCGIDFANTDPAIVSKAVNTDPITSDCTVSATFAIDQNTVIAIAGANGKLDAATPSPQTVADGETAQFAFNADAGYFLASVSGCGVEFANTDEAITSHTVTTSPFTQSCIVSATFATNQHTVNAIAGENGELDTSTPSPQTVADGETVQFTFNADAGYHVASISGCGIDYANTNSAIASKTVTTDPIMIDCTVSAAFAINENTVIAIAGANGKLDAATPSPQTVAYGETVQFSFNADAGYYVASVSGCGVDIVNTDEITSQIVTTSPFTQSCIVNALFTLKKNTVVAIAGENGRLSEATPSPQLVLNNGEITVFTFNADAGYHVATITGCGVSYVSVSDNIISKTIYTEPFTESCAVVAEFAINQYTVTAFVSPPDAKGNLDEGTPTPQIINHGETAQFTFNADPGYHISYITSYGHVTPPCGAVYSNPNHDNAITTMTVTTDPIMDDCSVRAGFWINQYTVNASAGPNGTLDEATPSPQTANYDESVQFIFNADAGYHVSSISGCGFDFTNTDDAIANKTVTIGPIVSDCTLSATFTINQNTVIATAGANGSLDAATPSPVTINYGETAQFIFNAVAGYHVASVSGCGIDYSNTDNAIETITVTTANFTESCIVVATFAIDANQLTVTIVGNGTGSVAFTPGDISCSGTCSAVYDYGASVTLTAIPGENSTFVAWSGDCTGANVTCDVTLNRAVNVTAQFNRIFPWPMFLPAITSKNTLP